jgi:hypothetical protein
LKEKLDAAAIGRNMRLATSKQIKRRHPDDGAVRVLRRVGDWVVFGWG